MRILILISMLSFLACQNKDTKIITLPVTKDSEAVITPQVTSARSLAIKDSTLLFESHKILNLIAQKDYITLSQNFHPDGVRFSLYGYVDSASDLTIKATDFAQNATKKRTWGMSYGDEKPILKNTSDYFKRHVYDADFLSVTKPTCNVSMPSGSTIINTAEAYKGCDYVEFYKAGTNPKYEGMDWRTLQLVFRKYQDQYKLVGIIHSEWTP